MRRQRSHRQIGQAMTEFALVSPVIFLLFFGIIDMGRLIYTQATLNQAVNEGARVAVRGEPPSYAMPSDVDVEDAVKSRSADVSLANPCPNGPITSLDSIPQNSGWLFITEAPAPTLQELHPPLNAPGMGAAGPGQTAPTFAANCNPVITSTNTPTLAESNYLLQVTIYYNFAPITPIIGGIIGNHILLHAYATYRTEY